MGVPVLIGVCNQEDGPSPAVVLDEITWKTLEKGTTLLNTTAIPVAKRVTTAVNASNSWTCPTGGVFYQYTAGTETRVQHSMKIGYSYTDLDVADLPVDGSCEMVIGLSSSNSIGDRPLWSYSLENGQFMPQKGGSLEMTIIGLDRSEIMSGASPTLLASNYEMELSPDDFGENPSDTINYSMQTGAVGTANDITYTIKLKLGNGTYISANQSVTFSATSIAENLTTDEALLASVVSQTMSYGVGGVGNPALVEVPAADKLSAYTFSSSNSWNASSNEFAEKYETPPTPAQEEDFYIGNSWKPTVTTKDIDLTEFPDGTGVGPTGDFLQYDYVFVWNGEEPGFEGSGLIWDGEQGQAFANTTGSPPSVSAIVSLEAEVETDQILNDGSTPQNTTLIEIGGNNDTPDSLWTAIRYYYAYGSSWNFNFYIRFHKLDGSYLETPLQNFAFNPDGVMETLT